MLNILYEDNHLLVVVKPQNIPTQADDSKDRDMLTLCKEYVKDKYNKPGNVYMGLVHRLDRPTGGVMVFARTTKCASRLTEQIKNSDMSKKYLAITTAKPKESVAKLVNYLKKDEKNNIVKIVPQLTYGAKYAELDYKVLDTENNLSLVEVNLVTGRSHQIRVQFKHIGCPLYGDAKYGTVSRNKKLALWAYYLKFKHPITNKTMIFKVFPPTDEMPWKNFKIESLI